MALLNELCKIFLDIKDGEILTLEKDKVYHVRQEDSFEFDGYYCTNTAKIHENPNGFRRTALYLKDKKDIIIDGNGASVIVHGKMTPFLFDKCENITVKNLTVDYACPTMTEFRVLSNENGVCTIKMNPDCLFRVEGDNLIWQGENGPDGNPCWEDYSYGNKRYIKVFDPVKEQCRDFRRDDLAFEKIEQIDDLTLKVWLKNKDADFEEGCIFQTRNIIRDQTGAYFNRCKNLCFENLRIKFMHGLGMVSQFCENVTYKNCDFTPAEGRTIASTADFFQFSGCKGNIEIDSCKAWGAQDDYVNVHGTSTPLGDLPELKALIDIMGEAAYKVNISSTKSMTGHLLGAAGAIEALACIMAIQTGVIPPTINLDEVDERIDPNLNLTPNVAQRREVKYAMSNTFGFGGHNACVILKKYAE